MTLKHIEFMDSPVMRSLARQEIQKGTIKPQEFVKEASLSIVASGDLFTDLVVLASSLRDKGFVKEAVSLEEKIFAYKKAAKDAGEVFLDKAHPEGDTKMGDAKDQLGEVETLPSAHRKMEEMVKKMPTGKLAQAQGLLNAVGYILKVGQTSLDESEEELSGRQGNVQKSMKDTVEYLSTRVPYVVETLKSQDCISSYWRFSEQLLASYKPARQLFGEYTEKGAEVNRYYSNNLVLFEDENFQGDPYAKVLSKITPLAQARNANELTTYGNLVGLGNKYFYGSQPSESKHAHAAKNPEQANSAMFKDNVSSIFEWDLLSGVRSWGKGEGAFGINSDKLKEAAKAIADAQIAIGRSLFAPELFDAADKKLQGKVVQILIPYNTVIKLFAEFKPETIKSVAQNAAGMRKQAVVLMDYTENGPLYKELLTLKGFIFPNWQPNISEKSASAIAQINEIVAFLGTKSTNEGDVIIEDSSVAANTFKSIAQIFFNAKKDLDKKSQMYQNFLANQRKVYGLSKLIAGATGKPYSELYKQIKAYLPKATSYDKLVEIANNLVQQAMDATGVEAPASAAANTSAPSAAGIGQATETSEPVDMGVGKGASLNSNLIKKSQENFFAGTKGNAVPANISSSSTPRTNLGLAKANMSDPKEAAVAAMQQYLAYFAQALANSSGKFKDFSAQDVATIVRTGPKANPAVNTYDGKWGQQTETALNVAKKYLDQLGLTGLDTKARYVDKITSDDAKEAADHNRELLAQVNQQLGVSGPAAQGGAIGSIYDRLPKNIQFGDNDLNVNPAIRQGNIPVTANDMNSMGALYQLLTTRLGVEPQVVESGDPTQMSVKGLTIRKWDEILKWFMARAKKLYNDTAIEKNVRQLSTEYHSSALRLWNQLIAYGKSANLTQADMDKIIPETTLPGAGGTSGGTATGIAQRGRNGRSGNGAGASGESVGESYTEGNMEGGSWGSTKTKQGFNSFPIWPKSDQYQGMIDLRQDWYGDLAARYKIRKPTLNIKEFQGLPARTMIQKYFGGRADGDPNLLYQSFLNELSTAVSSAVGGWNQTGEVQTQDGKKSRPNTAQISVMSDLESEWQDAINKQKDELSKFLTAPGYTY